MQRREELFQEINDIHDEIDSSIKNELDSYIIEEKKYKLKELYEEYGKITFNNEYIESLKKRIEEFNELKELEKLEKMKRIGTFLDRGVIISLSLGIIFIILRYFFD